MKTPATKKKNECNKFENTTKWTKIYWELAKITNTNMKDRGPLKNSFQSEKNLMQIKKEDKDL